MSIYERRWNYTVGTHSTYTDDVRQVLDAIKQYDVEWVADGYADYEDVPERPGRIGGTLITRRTERVLSAEEFIAEFAADAFVSGVADRAILALDGGDLEVVQAEHGGAMRRLGKGSDKDGPIDVVASFDVTDGEFTATVEIRTTVRKKEETHAA